MARMIELRMLKKESLKTMFEYMVESFENISRRLILVVSILR